MTAQESFSEFSFFNNRQEERTFYFYHPDHLGSSSYVTDIDGEVFQHVEYFPFGETWVEEHSNRQRTPYLFTGKELDEDTGLYYFGARYYDPRTSVWQSPDPILASYLQGQRSGAGVYTPKNLNLFGYVQQNPVRLLDPNGMETVDLSWDGFQAHVSSQWQNLKADVGNAVQNPGQAAIGGFKGLGNAAHGILWYDESGPYPTGLSALCGYCGSEPPFELNSAERGGALITGGALATVGARQALRTRSGGLPIPNDLSRKIHMGAQGKHIPGHNNFDPSRSSLTANAQELLDGVHNGQYPIVRSIPRGNSTSNIVDFGRPIGDFRANGELVGPTQYGQIVQGKNGAHIIPANPEQY